MTPLSSQQAPQSGPIKITEDKKIKGGWHFLVVVGGKTNPTHHYVTVEENYWRTLTKEELTPKELVMKSFQFLLEREPATSILTSFSLGAINQYFPEYETTLRSQSAKK